MTDNMTPTNNERDAVEKLAKLIYMQWALSPNYVQWVEGGNSHNQDKARSIAREFMKDYQSPISQNEQQEAVAWMIWWDGDKWLFTGDKEDFDVATKNKFPITPLYTSPPKQAIPDGWISIDEKIPNEHEWYLVFTGSFVSMAFFDSLDNSLDNREPVWLPFNDARDLDRLDGITHWMPLPEAPTNMEVGE